MPNRKELVEEIKRVETALERTGSMKLRHDYGRYLRRLYNSLKYYDRCNYGERTELKTI